MGWPRKNETYRIYRDKQGAYFLIDLSDVGSHPGYGRTFGAVANVYPGKKPSLVYTTIGAVWISDEWCKRYQWNELPEEWQKAFAEYMTRGGDTFDPADYRGLWRVGEQPKKGGAAR